MAQRAQPLTGRQPRLQRLAAGLALTLVLGLVFGTLAASALRAEGPGALAAADIAAIRFTVLQAALSAALSCLLAVPVARALARRRFPGRGLLITTLGAPFILPVLVGVLGLLTIFGRNGLVNLTLAQVGLPPVQIYGLPGVLLAHVFFNLPLATRLLLHGWSTIPAEELRLAAALSLGPRQTFRILELPMLARTLPGALVIVFLICLTSFAVVLTLGGGPRATTIELAIYQSFRLDFDLSRAALLALVQVGVGLAAALAALSLGRLPQPGRGLDHPFRRWDSNGAVPRLLDALSIALAAALLFSPLAAILLRGLPQLPPEVFAATLRSLLVALLATAVTGALALPLALAIGQGSGPGARWADALAALPVAASPLAIGTGLFLIVNPLADPVALALPLTALVNALMALPFALRALIPAVRDASRFDRLADSLGLTGFPRFRLVILPRLRAPLGFALGLAAALSMGDFGVIALFADPAGATLPMTMYGLMGAYRMAEAAGAALILVAAAFGLFWIFDRGGRNADA